MDQSEFFTLAVIHFLAIASPGPNVIATMSNAVTFGLYAGVMTALGVAIGNLFHIALGVFGVSALVDTHPKSAIIIALFGISYLAYIGYNRVRTSRAEIKMGNLTEATHRSNGKFLLDGVVINVTNIKGAIFFLMVFSTLISPQNPIGIMMFYGIWMAAVNFLFLSALAWVFRKDGISAKLNASVGTIDIISGYALIGVAAMLLLSLVTKFL